MKIENSAVQMNAAYSAEYTMKVKYSRDIVYTVAPSPGKNENPGTTSLSPDDQAGLLGAGRSSNILSGSVRETVSPEKIYADFHHSLLKYIIQMMHDMLEGKNFKAFSDKADYLTSGQDSGSNLQLSQVFYRESTSTFYSEKESVTFGTNGVVKTSDGRELSFSLDFSLSRSFMQETKTSIFGMSEIIAYKDPLVINMDIPFASVTDQTFFFDIDCDGTADEISSLGMGSGFLALDKNGDGIINDGSELFGTKSGDGFADLAVYDDDGNGWIDENDAIFSQLKVWTKDADGNDTLLSLKEADVGAIFLGHVFTGFHLKDDETNDTYARIQSTGIFLHESTGEVGTVQHVDFAV
ncbi:MAG: hypothetical protein J1F22_06580 [Lachnospiraceae bacterium]|nr:hypothetical protein [Lachnospiraceae bacterium]